MSFNYSKPHDVDVPVVDLDDPDDDAHLALDPPSRSSASFLDSLDYNHQRFQEPVGFFGKMRAYFTRLERASSYELMSSGSTSDFFEIDDELEPALARNDDLRNYHIKRLNRKLNKTILVFACALIFIFSLVFLRRDGLLNSGPSPKVKSTLSNSTHEFYPTTLMISLDGFHPHYISAAVTPNLHKMLVEDYGAPYMTPSFPSSTFPNHWTLVTGLYPSEHGIVGNTFFDPKLKKQFINTNPDFGLNPEFWQGGEPLWKTAAKNGIRSAIHMWPGSEVPTIGDDGPLFCDKYNGTEPLPSKVDRVMLWLDIADLNQRPELILAYVPTIDQIGHKFGITGENLTNALSEVDDFIGLVKQELSLRNLNHIVNLVVVSDHGMAPTSNDRLLFLDDVAPMDKIEHTDGWPLFGLRPFSKFTVDEIFEEIKRKFDEMGEAITANFNLYRVEDIPPEWHFGGKMKEHRFNYRLAPIWIIPNVGYSVITRKKFEENGNDYYPKGVHGYNNTELLMRAIFLAQGPYFETKLSDEKKVLPFENVEVYNIICDSLGIKPGLNNGAQINSKGFSISSGSTLPKDWRDGLVYPDLPFHVDHIVRNATYDRLWRISDSSEKPSDDSKSIPTGPLNTVSSQSAVDDKTTTSNSQATAEAADGKSTTAAEPEGFLDEIWSGIGDVAEELESDVEDAFDDAKHLVHSLLGDDESDTDSD